ncbi:hypothetical protein T492DRAFT_842855 [Pavlovales sp. CCMP2436]|nr:hypothetical protein T492DRAFT_842855 [Pavlovales sp. CCMP2436]
MDTAEWCTCRRYVRRWRGLAAARVWFELVAEHERPRTLAPFRCWASYIRKARMRGSRQQRTHHCYDRARPSPADLPLMRAMARGHFGAVAISAGFERWRVSAGDARRLARTAARLPLRVRSRAFRSLTARLCRPSPEERKLAFRQIRRIRLRAGFGLWRSLHPPFARASAAARIHTLRMGGLLARWRVETGGNLQIEEQGGVHIGKSQRRLDAKVRSPRLRSLGVRFRAWHKIIH